MQFLNKMILVTGASGEIGGATAFKLSSQGAKVIITGRNIERLKKVYENLHGTGHSMHVVDLLNKNEVNHMIELSTKDVKFSGIVHCAGSTTLTPLRTLSEDMLDNMMRVNFYSFIFLVKQLTKTKYFNEYGGSIVAISSTASDAGEAGQTAYAASKAALDASIRTLSVELASKKIRINSIRAGIIITEMSNNVMNTIGSNSYSQLVSKQLFGGGKPEDVANAAAFLLSDESRFITGRFLYVDGGRFL